MCWEAPLLWRAFSSFLAAGCSLAGAPHNAFSTPLRWLTGMGLDGVLFGEAPASFIFFLFP